jgi:hypothetical protein
VAAVDYKILKAGRVRFFVGMPLPENIDGLSRAKLKLLLVKLLE